jgi:hypothetical protein
MAFPNGAMEPGGCWILDPRFANMTAIFAAALGTSFAECGLARLLKH